MFPSAAEVARALRREVEGRGHIWMESAVILLLPDGAGWPIRLTVTGDVIRLQTGTSSRVPLGADEPEHLEQVVSVVCAIVRGDAEEYLGSGADGPLSVIGHRIWYPGGSIQQLDEGAAIVATHRAPPWVGKGERTTDRPDV